MNVLKALPSDYVHLVYLDPPFNSKSNYNLPFRGKYKNAKPVEAFRDTWTWGADQDQYYVELNEDPITRPIVRIIDFARQLEHGEKDSLGSYLINMAVRLIAMKRVLKSTGSVYLHCDPTASHYLKLIMDAIFGAKNFRNEIVWSYRTGGLSKIRFPRKHDILLFYSKGVRYRHNPLKEIILYDKPFFTSGRIKPDQNGKYPVEVYVRDVWEDGVKPIVNTSKERMGYPTQKPIKLLERIITASSDEGDLVLDPFCGCGTTLHAAENLCRQWIGIDVSRFSVELMKERLLSNFGFKGNGLTNEDIKVRGTPNNISEAEELANKDPFEFEKWVCGLIGAHGMYHNPGDRGRDGGIDGVIRFGILQQNGKISVKKTHAIVQVKGGKVTPDSVRALSQTVEETRGTAGIMVCFEMYMRTVNNNRKKDTFRDVTGIYPVIQGFSIEELMNNKKPKLPPVTFRQSGRIHDIGNIF